MGKGTKKVSTKSTSALFVILLVIISIVLLLQIAGFVAPGWYYTKYIDPATDEVKESHHGGLWYMVNCADDCETSPMTDEKAGTAFFAHKSLSGEKDSYVSGFYADYMLTLQIGCTVALGLTIFAFVLLIAARLVKKYLSSTILLTVVILLTLASGVLSLAICCDEAKNQLDESNRWDSHNALRRVLPNPIYFPYSLFLFGIAGILLCFLFILVVILLICNAYGLQKEGGLVISKHQEAMVSGNGTSPATVTRETVYVTDEPKKVPVVAKNNNYEVNEAKTIPQQPYVVHTVGRTAVVQQQPKLVLVPASHAPASRPTQQEHRTSSGRYVVWTGTNRSIPTYTKSHVTSVQDVRY